MRQGLLPGRGPGLWRKRGLSPTAGGRPGAPPPANHPQLPARAGPGNGKAPGNVPRGLPQTARATTSGLGVAWLPEVGVPTPSPLSNDAPTIDAEEPAPSGAFLEVYHIAPRQSGAEGVHESIRRPPPVAWGAAFSVPGPGFAADHRAVPRRRPRHRGHKDPRRGVEANIGVGRRPCGRHLPLPGQRLTDGARREGGPPRRPAAPVRRPRKGWMSGIVREVRSLPRSSGPGEPASPPRRFRG